jgi:putative spermidine/putrescine transport system ATP-binding protein
MKAATSGLDGRRNSVSGEPSCRVQAVNGDRARVEVADAVIGATVIEPVGNRAGVIAIRPDDLTPMAEGPIAATVENAEFRGQDFYGVARTSGGDALFFRSESRVRPGDALRLGALDDHVLLYPEEEQT